MVIKGFDILATREKYLIFDTDIYPKIYSIFYSTFEIGLGKILVPGVFLDQIKQVGGILDQQLDFDMDFIIHEFLSFEESKIYIENTYSEDDSCLPDYYPIAECDANKTLLVGRSFDNQDQIFLENLTLFSDGSRCKLLASNIFEFVSRIKFVERARIGYGIESYKQLVKNWGEFNYVLK